LLRQADPGHTEARKQSAGKQRPFEFHDLRSHLLSPKLELEKQLRFSQLRFSKA